MEANNKVNELISKRNEMLLEAQKLSKLKKKLYSKVDITQPMCEEEVKITKEISCIFSMVNQINIELRLLRK